MNERIKEGVSIKNNSKLCVTCSFVYCKFITHVWIRKILNEKKEREKIGVHQWLMSLRAVPFITTDCIGYFHVKKPT